MRTLNAEWEKKRRVSEIELEIKNIIIQSVGKHQGENFKRRLTLRELIDDKHERKTVELRFEYYVGSVDMIVEWVKIKWPHIDLTGITLDWTSDQIIDLVMNALEKAPVLTLDDMKKMQEK